MIFFASGQLLRLLIELKNKVQADTIEFKLKGSELKFGFIKDNILICLSSFTVDAVEDGSFSLDSTFLSDLNLEGAVTVEIVQQIQTVTFHLYDSESVVISVKQFDTQYSANNLKSDFTTYLGDINLNASDLKILKLAGGNWVQFENNKAVSNTDKWAIAVTLPGDGLKAPVNISKKCLRGIPPGNYQIYTNPNNSFQVCFEDCNCIKWIYSSNIGYDYSSLVVAMQSHLNKIKTLESVPSGFPLYVLNGAECYSTNGVTKVVNGNVTFLYRVSIVDAMPVSREKPKTFNGVAID